jgi:serine/threonine-protein kinase
MALIGIGTTLNERFLLATLLGRGGMGTVYSATDLVLQRRVAIKVLKEQSGGEVGKKLRLEAQIAARLLHENVVRIYDFGQAESTSYLVMEQVEGTSYKKRWPDLSLHQRLEILAQVASALDYAHHQGVIHRDVKPANVLLTAEDVPKLSDFGLSLLGEDVDQRVRIRGTPQYMSPEQAKGRRVDYHTDLYSLGVMLYESATGTLPFEGKPKDVLLRHVDMPPDPPRTRNPEISEPLEKLILSLLAKRAEARPASGVAVAEALRVECERIRSLNLTPPQARAADAILASAGPNLAALAGVERDRRVRADATTQAESSRGTRTSAALPSTAPQLAVPEFAPPWASAADLVASPLVRKMLLKVLDEPVVLSANERYLMGYYLAYLLIGSRRRGLFLQRPLNWRNADRARFLLAMPYTLACGLTDESIAEVAKLLDQQIDVRAALSPVVVAKYLYWRDQPQRRRLFRHARQAVQDASAYAHRAMIDAKGVLNPGLMPQSLDDLRQITPVRSLVDDELVERWNRLADAWRTHPKFRTAALRYASREAARDPASQALWPEVVYPLIELARWQRRFRSRAEIVWDAVAGRLFPAGDAGRTLDRLLSSSVSAQVVAQIDDSVNLLAKIRPVESEEDDQLAIDDVTVTGPHPLPQAGPGHGRGADARRADAANVALKSPYPQRFLHGELQQLWIQSANALAAQTRNGPENAAKPQPQRSVAAGPYRLVVVASVRGRAAGQLAIRVTADKQIELTTPSFRGSSSADRPILAVWTYQNNSMVLAHIDFQGTARYVLWYAPRAQQLKFDHPGELYYELENLSMELPGQLEEALSRRYGI